MKAAVEYAITEATAMALDDLRQVRERFNDDTENTERMKHANASIRLVQSLTRSWTPTIVDPNNDGGTEE